MGERTPGSGADHNAAQAPVLTGASGATFPTTQPSHLTDDEKTTTTPPTTQETGAREAFRVSYPALTLATDPLQLPETPDASNGLFELVSPIARRALDLGLSAREPSFHVFVSAAPEVMIEDDVVAYATRLSAHRPTPPDIVYVHDFDRPEAPRPIVLPPGRGPDFASAMDELVARLREHIPSLAETEEMKRAQALLAKELETQTREVLAGLESTAKTLGFGIRTVQNGVQTFPILHGKPLSAEQFEALDESTKRALGHAEERLTAEVEKAANQVREKGAAVEQARHEAFAEATKRLVDAAMEALRERFADAGDDVLAYLETVHTLLVEDWADFVQNESENAHEHEHEHEGGDDDPEHAHRLARFKVNVLVTHEPGASSPVVYDTNPTYPNIFGYLERRARFGALLTDFTRVRPGSLHRASGGVLVVRAADMLADPIIWERLKRVLREKHIGAEDPLGPLGLYATSLRPVPVPIRVRVVLVGPPDLYGMLAQADADFAALFRIKVEVEPSIPRQQEHLVALDAYLMKMADEREWGRFDRKARARLLDLATRLAGDREKLALALSPLEETMAFACALATARQSQPQEAVDGASTSRETLEVATDKNGQSSPRPFRASIAPTSLVVVTAEDVDVAWRERRDRLGSTERQIRELAVRGEIAVETAGERVGVVNGLSVFSLGDVEFGQPMRITAVVALGREGIIDVEREAQLGGAIHTKGVAIVRGYLSRLFGQERPLSLRAQIAIEQSYGEIDGDSASSAELFAVLSALADVPVDQGIAVTGSVNQLGELQAIGGVCAKIEGFFDLCAARGLTGKQGVLIPRANLPHLVLRDDVLRAVEEKTFHLWAIDKVEQGIDVLTGITAGKRDMLGHFPASSVFGRVERRLIEIAERLREAEGHVRRDPDVSQHDVGDTGDDDSADFRVR